MNNILRIEAHHLQPKPISEDLNLNDFDCGDADLNDFLKNDALKYETANIAKTICLFYEEKLIGFFSLAADSFKLSWKEKRGIFQPTKQRLHFYPAVKIARMGFIKEF